MFSQKATDAKIVIVGGGFAGILLAKKLQNDHQVTLIDKKDFFESTPSLPVTLVKPQHLQKIRCPYRKFLKKTTIITDEVESLRKNEIVLKSGQALPYDYLCLGTGARYEFPFKSESICINPLISIDHEHILERLQTSQVIGIVGGGTVGVEILGELLNSFPQKQFHLISATESLMEKSLPSAHPRAAAHFASYQNLTLHLGDRVVDIVPQEQNPEKRAVVTSRGKNIPVDILFYCTGNVPNTEYVRHSTDPEFRACVDQWGYILVNEFLQVQGFENVFAVGDIVAIQEEKLAQTAQQHAIIAAKNIKRHQRGKTLEIYKPTKKIMIVTLGPHKALVADENGIKMEGFFASKMKQLVEYKIMTFDA